MASFSLKLVNRDALNEKVNQRKFVNAKVQISNVSIIEILKWHNLTTLEISNCTIEIDKTMLVAALISKPRWESLTMKNVFLSSETNEAESGRVPLKLKSIFLSDVDKDILSLISTTTLESFVFHTKGEFRLTQSRQIALFLSEQSKLENLSIGGTDVVDIITALQEFNYSFRLKRITIRNDINFAFLPSFRMNFPNEVGTIFLEVHKNTLQELTLINFLIDKNLLCFILDNMQELNTLAISTEGIDNFRPVDLQSRLSNVKELTIYNELRVRFAINFLKCFPSLTSFNGVTTDRTRFHFNSAATDRGCFLLADISRKYPLLNRLHIPFYSEDNDYLIFRYLKELHVETIGSRNYKYFCNFLLRLDFLEKLTIGWISSWDFVENSIVTVLNHCNQLKYVSITTDDNPAYLLDNLKMRDYQWSLEICCKGSPDDEDGWKNVYRFPDDEALIKINRKT